MTTLGTESKDGQEGLFFLSEIKSLVELGKVEFALWLGRGAWAGITLEHQEQAQQKINEHRARLNDSAVLGQVDSI